MRIRLSIRARFALTFAGLIVLSSVVLSLVLGSRAGRMAEAQIGANLAELALQMADKLDQAMWSRSQEVLLLASLDALRRPGDGTAARRMMEQLRQRIPVYSWIGQLGPDGEVREATDGILKGRNIAQRPVFSRGREGLFVGDVHDALLLARLLPNPTGEAMQFVDVSAPLHDDAGRFTGVLATHLSWTWAREVRESVLGALQKGRSLELFVVAADGTVLLGTPELLGKRLDLPLLEQAKGVPSAWAVEDWPDGGRYLTGAALGDGHRDYKGLGWTVLTRQPVKEAYASVRGLLRDTFVTGAALSLLFALAGWIIAERVARPLKAMAAAADRIRLGQGATLPEHHDIPEIETLSASLSTLIDSLTRSEKDRSRMRRLATKDPLTGLGNRLGLSEHLATALPRLARGGDSLAVLCLDLDGFKAVNDSRGHAAGDELLRQVAIRLRGCLRAGDTVTRQGGDEFVALLEGRAGGGDIVETLRLTASRMLEALSQPFYVEGEQAHIGVSIGAALWPRHGEDFAAVLAKADAALYEAKRGGRNRLSIHSEG